MTIRTTKLLDTTIIFITINTKTLIIYYISLILLMVFTDILR